MNRNDIIRMAHKSNLVWRSEASRKNLDPFICNWHGSDEELFNFAALIASQEREACAKVCDDLVADGMRGTPEWNSGVLNCVAAILARGEKP